MPPSTPWTANVVRPNWMYRAATKAQAVACMIAVGTIGSADEVRSALSRSVPTPRNELEHHILEGLISRALHELEELVSLSRASMTASSTVAHRAASILRERFPEKWTIDRLAHEVGTNRFRLTTEFKGAFGVGVHEYLVACRIRAAENSIRTGEKIEATAYAVGFRSKKTLYDAFKRLRGTSLKLHRRHTR